MAISELKKTLIAGLSQFTNDTNLMLLIALAMKTDAHMEAMLDYLVDHRKEPLEEEELLEAMRNIQKRFG